MRVVRFMSVRRGGSGELFQCAEVPFFETNAMMRTMNKMNLCIYSGTIMSLAVSSVCAMVNLIV